MALLTMYMVQLPSQWARSEPWPLKATHTIVLLGPFWVSNDTTDCYATISTEKIYQACLSAFLLLQAKVDGPSFHGMPLLGNHPYLGCWRWRWRRTCTNLKKASLYGKGLIPNWLDFQIQSQLKLLSNKQWTNGPTLCPVVWLPYTPESLREACGVVYVK